MNESESHIYLVYSFGNPTAFLESRKDDSTRKQLFLLYRGRCNFGLPCNHHRSILLNEPWKSVGECFWIIFIFTGEFRIYLSFGVSRLLWTKHSVFSQSVDYFVFLFREITCVYLSPPTGGSEMESSQPVWVNYFDIYAKLMQRWLSRYLYCIFKCIFDDVMVIFVSGKIACWWFCNFAEICISHV